MVEEISFLSEFAFEIILIVIVFTGGSVSAYFANLKKCVRLHKIETNAKIAVIDARSFRLSKAFLHFVRRNDELHKKDGTPTISLGDEIENLLKDPKTGNF